MNDATGGVFNTVLVRDFVCAQCWKPLVEKFIEGEGWKVLCPRGCQPGGFVTRGYAERRYAKELEEFYEVADYYPDLDPRPKLGAEKRARIKAELYGE